MSIIGVFGQFVFYAQAFKIFTTHSANDVSLFGFSAGLLSVTSWLIYGFTIKDKPLVIANSVAVIGAILVITGIIKYA